MNKAVCPRGRPSLWIALCLPLIAVLACCDRPASPEPASSTPPAEISWLQIEVQPSGATVWIDSQVAGVTPVVLTLAPGLHAVRVEQAGYEPLAQDVTLIAGAEATISGALLRSPTTPVPGDITSTPLPPATQTPEPPPPAQTPLPDLLVKRMWITLETGSACDYASTQLGVRVTVENAGQAGAGPFAVELSGVRRQVDGLSAGATAELWFAGYVQSGENTAVADVALQVQENDEENNTLSQRLPVPTLPPTCTPPPITSTPTPSPTPPPAPAAVAVRNGQVTIPTYPYAAFTSRARNEAFNMPYLVLDRQAYDDSSPAPQNAAYKTVEMENEFLKLTFLPEVGGRLYEVFYKPTGHRVTYRNAVLKPSRWGPPEQGWWLAAGGLEWCLPVEEHGYEWGVPWTAEVSRDAKGATVTLRDTTASDRVRAAVAVRLEAGAGHFTIRPRLENPTGASLAIKYWTNAMLAPGGRNAPSADLRFILPDAVTAVTVHSRGDDWLPGADERMPWPIYNDIDLSRLGNWNRWLGFFEDPAAGGFMAVYDQGYDEGVVRVFPGTAQGAKGFGFGWNDRISPDNYTDDASGYVEMHGGPAPTFADSVTLPAGGHLEWTETWYPVAGMGGLRYANAAAALDLTAGGRQIQIAVATTRRWSGDVVLRLGETEFWRSQVSLAPGKPLRQTVIPEAPWSGPVTLRLVASDGSVTAEYRTDLTW